MLKNYQKELVHLLCETNALAFGSFTLKSGRISPYFVNTGMFDCASVMSRLGSIYANHMHETGLDVLTSVLFGPAYKGIPLATAAGIALFREFSVNCRIAFDRKEEKDHGERGKLMGRAIASGSSVTIVEDVITAGVTLREIVPMLNAIAGVKVNAIVIALDRCEKGQGDVSAREEIQKEFSLVVSPILTIYQVLDYLSSDESGTDKLSEKMRNDVLSHLEMYAAKQ